MPIKNKNNQKKLSEGNTFEHAIMTVKIEGGSPEDIGF